MKTRQPNIIDRTMRGQVKRPQVRLIDQLSEKPPRQPRFSPTYRVRLSSGFVLR
jgi:hypothetical protein